MADSSKIQPFTDSSKSSQPVKLKARQFAIDKTINYLLMGAGGPNRPSEAAARKRPFLR